MSYINKSVILDYDGFDFEERLRKDVMLAGLNGVGDSPPWDIMVEYMIYQNNKIKQLEDKLIKLTQPLDT